MSCSWPFFFGFGVVGFAMAKISVPTGTHLPPCLSCNSYMLTVLLMTSLSHAAEQNLKDSTITPHEDKKYAATA